MVIKMEGKRPERKPNRIKNYDYSAVGAYFVTICTQDRKPILSEVIKTDNVSVCETDNYAVGEGLAPPVYIVKLKPCGEIAEEQLKNLEKRYPNVTIEDYIIMPDHIHTIIFLHKQAGGASPSPTLSDVICAFKSLSARLCKQKYEIEDLFQRSFADHIIRDREDYETRRKYIHENPIKWYYRNKKYWTHHG